MNRAAFLLAVLLACYLVALRRYETQEVMD